MTNGRIRRSVKTDRLTGEQTETEEIRPPANFQGRIAALKASAGLALIGDGPVENQSATLQCDGCGTKAELDYNRPELPAGWVERDDGDFCPACQRRTP